MTRISKRVDHAYARIHRAVAGAVVNTAHGHPKWGLSDTIARSIAKRAAGTLLAQWPEVLAAVKSSLTSGSPSVQDLMPRSSASRPRGRGVYARYTPLDKLWKKLSKEVGKAKYSGNTERARTLIEVLKLIDKINNDQKTKT